MKYGRFISLKNCCILQFIIFSRCWITFYQEDCLHYRDWISQNALFFRKSLHFLKNPPMLLPLPKIERVFIWNYSISSVRSWSISPSSDHGTSWVHSESTEEGIGSTNRSEGISFYRMTLLTHTCCSIWSILICACWPEEERRETVWALMESYWARCWVVISGIAWEHGHHYWLAFQ